MKNQKNVVIAALTAVLLAIAVLLYASPYIALHSIKKALDNKDTAALSQFVDYPVLRENMKAKLMSSMCLMLPSAATHTDNPLANIGQAIGGMVIGVAVDNLVSPQGVLMMMDSGYFGPKFPSSAQPPADQGASGGSAQDPDKSRSLSLNYQGFDKVRVFRKSAPENAFIFRRDGLMGWKLINVDARGM